MKGYERIYKDMEGKLLNNDRHGIQEVASSILVSSTFLALELDGSNIVGLYADDDRLLHGFFATQVPEPSTILLLGAGLAGVGLFRRKFRK